jgi:alkaline phosphatase D
MNRRSLLKTLASIPALAHAQSNSPARVWLGPQYWANPLQDWQASDGRIECAVSGGDRNVYWLTRELTGGDFTMSVRLGRRGSGALGEGWAGFRSGVRGYFKDYRDSAVTGTGLDAGITSDGRLFIGEFGQGPRIASLDDLTLALEHRNGKLTLRAGSESMTREVPADWVTGGVALVCHSGKQLPQLPGREEPKAAVSGKPGHQNRGGNVMFWFRNWTLDGPGAVEHADRAWGPILFNQYTVSRGVLKMTVQFAPLEEGQPPAELQVNGRTVARAAIEPFSATATFRVSGWDASQDKAYTVLFQGQKYSGTIRRDPMGKSKIVVGALTCQYDFGFPHTDIAAKLQSMQPDILFFTGDQLYESNGGYGIQRAPLEAARLDYLRKWFLFGWAWGSFTRDIPTVSLPDDHDVYHGNVWGAGGRKAEYPAPGTAGDVNPQQVAQDSGGYCMPAKWVNLVERTQSSHLPDPPDPTPVDQDIAVHFCHLVWGGVSFAVLEDRKWKSAPKTFLPEAKILNGWPQNPQWKGEQGDVPGAQLLGERQERFLAEWARDWKDSWIKAVISETIFCNLATLPVSMMSDAGTPKLPVMELGGYAPGEKLTMDHDSNAWPQTPRNRALRLMRLCAAVHIAGDQHLGSTLQYGIDDFNDGPWSICTPSISNMFPRRWYPPTDGANRPPGAPRNFGEYRDGFGNHMTVHALANPQKFGATPAALHERAPGFGTGEFDRATHRITLTNYPRYGDKPYPGWPVTIDQMDNGLSKTKWAVSLPESVSGLVEVLDGKGDLVYTFKLPRAVTTLPVWREGRYEVRAGGKRWATLSASPVPPVRG